MLDRAGVTHRGERERVADRVRGLLASYDARDDPRPIVAQPRPYGRWPDGAAGVIARVRAAGGRVVDGERFRVVPGHRGALAMGIAALVAAVVACVWVFAARPHAAAVPVGSGGPVSGGSVSGGSSPTAGPRASSSPVGVVVVVDVVGRVVSPGLYRLPAGSRIDDALKAAGGPLPGTDLTTLNLAQRVTDGQQVAVGVSGAPAPAGSAAESAATGPVDLNSATLGQLDALPGVGPVLAQHILDWRTTHGRFDSIDQLREVSGIGPAKYSELRPLVTV